MSDIDITGLGLCAGCDLWRVLESGSTLCVDCEEDSGDGPYYCPHGVEVQTPGGACYRCAQEDADDSDY